MHQFKVCSQRFRTNIHKKCFLVEENLLRKRTVIMWICAACWYCMLSTAPGHNTTCVVHPCIPCIHECVQERLSKPWHANLYIHLHTYIYIYAIHTYIYISGGAEQAMMSTTSNLSVAVRYSLSSGSLLFKIKVELWTDHGAGEEKIIYNWSQEQ